MSNCLTMLVFVSKFQSNAVLFIASGLIQVFLVIFFNVEACKVENWVYLIRSDIIKLPMLNTLVQFVRFCCDLPLLMWFNSSRIGN